MTHFRNIAIFGLVLVMAAAATAYATMPARAAGGAHHASQTKAGYDLKACPGMFESTNKSRARFILAMFDLANTSAAQGRFDAAVTQYGIAVRNLSRLCVRDAGEAQKLRETAVIRRHLAQGVLRRRAIAK